MDKNAPQFLFTERELWRRPTWFLAAGRACAGFSEQQLTETPFLVDQLRKCLARLVDANRRSYDPVHEDALDQAELILSVFDDAEKADG